MSDSLWPHGQQHARLLCPSLSPRVCSNSCPLRWWYQPAISSFPASSPFAFALSQQQGLFQWVASLYQVAKIGASALASIIPVNSQGWFPLGLTVGSPCSLRDSRESSPAQSESINSLALRLLYGPILTSIHDYWKNHSFDYMNLCQQSDISAF